MSSEIAPPASRPSLLRALRHHVALVALLIVAGALVGWLLAAAQPATYTSTADVLVNPTVGNPFAPAPSSVRQDELTSLETEAQVARSAEVMRKVSVDNPSLDPRQLQGASDVAIPPNTQILELTITLTGSEAVQQVTNSWAASYLENRDQRAADVNAERVARVESQTQRVVTDLRAATTAAQRGSDSERLFQTELASALRNELVSLRAQRSYLENSESPAGSIISPASPAKRTGTLTPFLMVAGGVLVGLVVACLIAAVLERLAGVVRSASEVEATGLPVLAAVPHGGWRARVRRGSGREAVEATIRRLRARVLALDPSPEIIAVAPAGAGAPDVAVVEAVAESFAKAGHRVVLVRADGPSSTRGLEVEERGLSEVLLHDRLDVHEMLQPSVEPLLCLLPWGSGPPSSDLVAADRLRAALMPLVEAGHLVILQSTGVDSAEGEAVVGAADLGVVVVRPGRTRARGLRELAEHRATGATALAALVIDSRRLSGRGRHTSDSVFPVPDMDDAVARDPADHVRR